MQTRRDFLARSSMALAGVGLAVRPLHAIAPPEWRHAASRWISEPIHPATLSQLAERAMQAAKDAGASYADIRLGEAQGLFVAMGLNHVESVLSISSSKGYGIRVLVDGIWGFVSGVTVTPDRMVHAAQEAVTHAKNQARALVGNEQRRVELPAVPVVQGQWQGPVEIDPFAVPLYAHREQLGAQCGAMARVLGVDPGGSSVSVSWRKETRVVASTEGTLVQQSVIRATPSVTVNLIGMPNYGFMTGGFEVFSSVALVDRVKNFSDEVVRMKSFPASEIDVGRYPVVMAAHCAAPLAHVLSQACEADRVLGLEADASGTSFLAPYTDVLAASSPQFSPGIDLRVVANEHAATYWHWDGEGVRTEDYPLVRDGRIVNYCATRETAGLANANPALAVKGGAFVAEIDKLPVNVAGELTLEPSAAFASRATASSLEDLAHDVDDGLLVWGEGRAFPDPGLATMFFTGGMWRVKNGKIVGSAPGVALMLRTQHLWKESLAALGGSSTVERTPAFGAKGMPWQSYIQLVNMPAARFNDVDVVRTSGVFR